MKQFEFSNEMKEMAINIIKKMVDIESEITQQQKEKMKRQIDNAKTWADLIEMASKMG